MGGSAPALTPVGRTAHISPHSCLGNVCSFDGSNLDGSSICGEYKFVVEDGEEGETVYVYRPPCLVGQTSHSVSTSDERISNKMSE